jgi:hypothetical protein
MSGWPPFVIEAMQTLSIPYWEEGGDEPLVTFVGRWGGVDADSVRKAVHQASGEELVLAVILLGKSQGTGAADELTRLQWYPKQRDVRWRSALQLSELGDRRARPALETMLVEDLPTPAAFADPEVQQAEAHDWLLQRASAAHYLGTLGGQSSNVVLRQALERALELEPVLSSEVEHFVLTRLHVYQSALASAMGQLGGLGGLTGLHPADPAVWEVQHQAQSSAATPQESKPGWHLTMLCIDVVMGHLRNQFDFKTLYSRGHFSFDGLPELREQLAVQLRQVFGWPAHTIASAITDYEIHQLSDLSFL